MIIFVVSGSILVIHYQAFAIGCYDKFIFNWFSLNDVLICLDNSSGGGGVISLNSSNEAITVNATSGNILISPKYELLCQEVQNSTTSLRCDNFDARQFVYYTFEIDIGGSGGSTAILGIQFNGDTNTNYSWRRSINGGADTTASSNSECRFLGTTTVSPTVKMIINGFIDNSDGNEAKMIYGSGTYDLDTTATTAPNRVEFACKYDASAQITTMNVMRASGTSTIGTNSELAIWGYD